MKPSKQFEVIKTFLSFSLLLISIVIAGEVDDGYAATPSKKIAVKQTDVPGAVYTMRGGFLGIFSTGMAKLANTLRTNYHVNATNTAHINGSGLSRFIIEHYRLGDRSGPIILAGHSLGANEQIKVAAELGRAHVPVALLIIVDAGLPFKVSDNVKQVLNLYQPTIDPVFRGLPLEAEDPSRTHIQNLDVSTIKNVHVNHFTISQNQEIQKIMLQKILEVLKIH